MAAKAKVDEIIHILRVTMQNALEDDVSSLGEQDVMYLIAKTRKIFLSQPMLLELPAPLKVCGNILGQYTDLVRLFDTGGLPPQSSYLFLGDYVDRGFHSVETICLLMCYKIKHPGHIFLLRGHHECARVNKDYGFYNDCKRRFSESLWLNFVDLFNCMPVAAVVDKKIFCCHGGPSPELISLDQIRMIPRPVEVPEHGLLCDLLYADPSEDVDGWAENHRGVSVTFGKDVVDEFLKKFNLDLIVRSHQVAEFGYEFFGNKKLLTIFSATNFCHSGNYGVILNIGPTLVCKFEILRPKRFNIPRLSSTKSACLYPNKF